MSLVLCVKACGGQITHWVDTATHVALCGEAPKNRPSAKMKARGRWLQWKDQNAQRDVCPKCVAKWELRA